MTIATHAAVRVPLFDMGPNGPTAPGGPAEPIGGAEGAAQSVSKPISTAPRSPEAPALEAAAPTARPRFDVQFLALAQVKGIGFLALRALVDHYGDLARVWEDDSAALAQILGQARIPNSDALATVVGRRRSQLLAEGERVRDELARRNVWLIAEGDPAFPPQLRQLPESDVPRWLFVEGDVRVLTGPPSVAIVGTRQASNLGRKAASRLAVLVAEAGLTVISGLAEGIDAAAHAAAAFYRAPQVAVLGTGINIEFPASSRPLRHQIVEDGGAVVTEYLPNDSYDGQRFVQRNRIQAALAALVCPVESKERSGTAHTFRFALRYGRPLFGVTVGRPSPENEMLGMLAGRGAPIFDLGDVAGVAELRRLFDALDDSRRWPAPVRPEPPVLFRSLVRKFDELQSAVGVSQEELQWLMGHLGARVGGARDSTRLTRGKARPTTRGRKSGSAGS